MVFNGHDSISSTNKTDRHEIPVTEILLKMALNPINLTEPNKIVGNHKLS